MKAYAPRFDPGMVLAQATVPASALLGLTGAALSKIIGLSEFTVSRVSTGARPPHHARYEGGGACRLRLAGAHLRLARRPGRP